MHIPEPTPAWEDAVTAATVDRRIMVDEGVYRQELDRIFRPSWQFVGFESEVREPGDYVLRTMGDDPVILIRSENGQVGVLLNSCTHRGTLLCRATFGNTSHLRCSYHGWTFANDGRLAGVPSGRSHYPASFSRSDFDLPRPHVATYRGFVFATWNDDAPDLEVFLGDFRWYLDALLDMGGDGGWEVYAPPQRVRVRGNWKLKQENLAGDGYHLQNTHAVAFAQGIFPQRRGEVDGFVINTPEGHAVRLGYDSGSDRTTPEFRGFPEDLWPEIAARLTPEQLRLLSGCEYAHGTVFPNCAFLTNAQSALVADDGDAETRFLVWRQHLPIGPSETEIVYWALVPSDMPEDWKRLSYAMQVRVQSAGGLFFEFDDFENFSRIDAASHGRVAGEIPFDYGLASHLDPEIGDFPGPGNVQHLSISEHNQRAFYQRWAEMMRP